MQTDDVPLVIPPRQNSEGAIVLQRADQKHEVVIRRRSTADIQKHLSPALQDSWDEIASAPKALQTDYMGFRQMNWGRVGGMSPTEVSAYMLDLKKRYLSWRVHMTKCSIMSLSICERVCQYGDPLRTVCRQERIGYTNAIKLLQYGLNEHSILAGWGDQIGGNNTR